MRAGAVVDVREHQDGKVAVQLLGNLVCLDQPQLQAAFSRKAFGDVEIVGKLCRSDTINFRVGASARCRFNAAVSTL